MTLGPFLPGGAARGGGVELPGSILEPQPSLTAARAALAAGDDGDVVDVYGVTSQRRFCELKRLSSGVYVASSEIDFTAAQYGGSDPTFTAGTGGTEDIVLSAAVTPSIGANGLVLSAAAYAWINFAGDFDPHQLGVLGRIVAAATTGGSGAHAFLGFARDDTRGGLAGGIYHNGAAWGARGFSGDLAAATVSGTDTYTGAPTSGTTAAFHWGRGGTTQSYAIAGHHDDAEDGVGALVSGATVLNWNTATRHRLLFSFDPVASDLTCALARVRLAAVEA